MEKLSLQRRISAVSVMQEAARELWKKRTSQGDAQAPHPGCRYQVGLNFTFRQHLDFSWGPLEDKCFLSIYGLTYQQMCPAADSEIWSGASIYRKPTQSPRTPCIACVYCELSSALYAPSCCIHSTFLRCSQVKEDNNPPPGAS